MSRPRRTQRQPASLRGYDLSGGVAVEEEGADDEPPGLVQDNGDEFEEGEHDEVVQHERNVEVEVGANVANVEVVAHVEGVQEVAEEQEGDEK